MTSPQASAPAPEAGLFPDPKRERNFLLLLAAMQFTHIVDFMILMPMGPQLMRIFSMSPAGFGSVVSAYTYSAGIASILAAIFLDRFDKRRTLLAVYFGFIVGTLLCGLAPNAHLLLLARILCGAFGGVMVALIFALISDAIPIGRRGAAMGIVMTAFSVASIAGVPLGLVLSNQFGWHMPFFALTAVSIAMWIAAFRLLPSMRRAPQAYVTSPLADFAKILSVPAHWRAFAFTFAMMGSTFLVIPYISSFFVANAGVANGHLPWVFFGGGLATFFTLRWFGGMGDRHGLYRVYAFASAGAILPVLAITHLGSWGLAAALPVTVAFMVLVSGRAAPGMALVTTVVEPRLRGGFMSLNTALQQLASGAASQAAGLMIVQNSAGRFEGYGRVGWVSAAGLVLSILIASTLAPKPKAATA